MKKTVKYLADQSFVSTIVVGRSATIVPVDHPDDLRVTNGNFAFTSTVQKVNEDGSFETLNTFYIPV